MRSNRNGTCSAVSAKELYAVRCETQSITTRAATIVATRRLIRFPPFLAHPGYGETMYYVHGQSDTSRPVSMAVCREEPLQRRGETELIRRSETVCLCCAQKSPASPHALDHVSSRGRIQGNQPLRARARSLPNANRARVRAAGHTHIPSRTARTQRSSKHLRFSRRSRKARQPRAISAAQSRATQRSLPGHTAYGTSLESPLTSSSLCSTSFSFVTNVKSLLSG